MTAWDWLFFLCRHPDENQDLVFYLEKQAQYNPLSLCYHSAKIEFMSKSPAVYILTNKPQGTLYIGVTSNLIQRIWQHKNHQTAGFSARYNLEHLVYFEMVDDMYSALSREKQLKNWKREWKIQLIEQSNPHWRDLWLDICG